MAEDDFTIANKLKGNSPRGELPFKLAKSDLFKIKEEILGREYELSLVFAESGKMRELNMLYRKKNEPTDILSFPLSPASGEIFICPEEAEKEAPKFKRPPKNFALFLFIHGLLHLKGMEHSSKMEAMEQKYREQFGV